MALRAAPRPTASRQQMELSRLALTDFRIVPCRGARARPGPDRRRRHRTAPGRRTSSRRSTPRSPAARIALPSTPSSSITARASRACVLELAGGTSGGGSTIELVVPGGTPTPGIRKRLTVNGVRAALDVGRRDGAGGALPAGGDAPPRRLAGGTPPLPRRHRRAAGPPLGARPRRAWPESSPSATRSCARSAPRRPSSTRSASGTSSSPSSARGSCGRGSRRRRDRGADRAAARRRGGARGRGGGSVSLELSRRPQGGVAGAAHPRSRIPEADELMAAHRRRIADVRQQEAWNGVSLVGPQRDDVRAELGGRDVASHASRGQQRTIILAMKLAETDLLGVDGPRPIVLLDDVFSELDPDRAARLSDLLAGRGQVIVTTADPGDARGGATGVTRPSGGSMTGSSCGRGHERHERRPARRSSEPSRPAWARARRSSWRWPRCGWRGAR